LSKQLIITADDLGISPQTNEAVSRACDNGILTSASLLANGPAMDGAVACLRSRPQFGAGVHLCLTSMRAVLPATTLPLLVDEQGRFRHGFLGIWRLMKSRHQREAGHQINAEFQAQIEKVLAAGLAIDHLDSHQHVHMIPGVFSMVVGLAQRYGRLAVRLARETRRCATGPIHLCLVGQLRRALLNRLSRMNAGQLGSLRCADAVWGIAHSGQIGRPMLRTMIAATGEGVTEIIVHPAMTKPACSSSLGRADRLFLASAWRQEELEALLDAESARVAHGRGVELTTFREAFQAASTVDLSRA